jgi:glycosyltransferase involved in cell wall biosynthesis
VRLLVVSQYFWPENFRINDLVAELQRRGHHVTVLTGLPNYPEGVVFPEYRREAARFGNHEGAEVIRVPLIPRGKGARRLMMNYASFALTAATLGTWRLRGRQFDAIFAFQVSPVTLCLPAILIGGLKRIPVVIWVLDLWPDTLAAIGAVRSPWLLGLIGRMVAFIYRRSDLILAQSRAFLPSIAKSAGGAPVRYFPAWVEPLFRDGLGSVEPAPEVREFAGTFNVLFAGNIGESQDFPAILDAAEALRGRADIRWLIVGDGRATDWVRSEVTRRGLEENVRLLGRHAVERMPSFFRAAGALLVTLKRDPVFAMTIPGKLQTYLATGLPIVALLDGEGARVLDESGAGLVGASGDSVALAEQVVRLAALSAAARAAIGARGPVYAAREFGREQLVSQFEGWLHDLGTHEGGTT